jgi:hypothetical protein
MEEIKIHGLDKQYLNASGCFTHQGVLLVTPLAGFVPAGKEPGMVTSCIERKVTEAIS